MTEKSKLRFVVAIFSIAWLAGTALAAPDQKEPNSMSDAEAIDHFFSRETQTIDVGPSNIAEALGTAIVEVTLDNGERMFVAVPHSGTGNGSYTLGLSTVDYIVGRRGDPDPEQISAPYGAHLANDQNGTICGPIQAVARDANGQEFGVALARGVSLGDFIGGFLTSGCPLISSHSACDGRDCEWDVVVTTIVGSCLKGAYWWNEWACGCFYATHESVE